MTKKPDFGWLNPDGTSPPGLMDEMIRKVTKAEALFQMYGGRPAGESIFITVDKAHDNPDLDRQADRVDATSQGVRFFDQFVIKRDNYIDVECRDVTPPPKALESGEKDGS